VGSPARWSDPVYGQVEREVGQTGTYRAPGQTGPFHPYFFYLFLTKA
jgi:hypothetical protein